VQGKRKVFAYEENQIKNNTASTLKLFLSLSQNNLYLLRNKTIDLNERGKFFWTKFFIGQINCKRNLKLFGFGSDSKNFLD
jgi:hypothetical protein